MTMASATARADAAPPRLGPGAYLELTLPGGE